MPALFDATCSLSDDHEGRRRSRRMPLLALALACAACGGGGGGGTKTVASFAQASTAVSEGNAGTTDVTFTVTLNKKAKQARRYDYATADGTAVAPGDYTATSGTLIIPKGAKQGTIAVSVVGDTVAEIDESFTLNLTTSKGQLTATTTILNDDAPPGPALGVAAGGIKLLSFSWNQVVAAANYRLLSDPDGASGFTQLLADLQSPQGTYDLPVSAHLTDWAGARFALEACNPSGCTQSNAVSIASEMLGVIGLGKASNPGAGDGLGFSVAVSGDGSTLALGAVGEASAATGIGGDELDDSAPGSGAVYVFARSGSTWVQEAYVKASNAEAGDGFGTALALSYDGDTLVVGAEGEDSAATGSGGDPFDDSALQSGAVYVFSRSAGAWAEEAYVKAGNTGAGDRFGAALALSDDGSALVVGAPGEDSAAVGPGGDPFNDLAADSGAAYVLARSGGLWTQEAYLKASNTQADDGFGAALALSGDGGTLAVGAPGEDSDATGLGGDQLNDAARDSGAVFVFAGSGSSWVQELYAKASNSEGGDAFGSAVELSYDGDVLLVGAPSEDGSDVGLNGKEQEDDFKDSGAAYLLSRTGGVWAQDLYVKASNTGTGDGFGSALTLSAAGDVFAVGAPLEDGDARGIGGNQASNASPSSGAVYAFARPGPAWAQVNYVKAANTEAGDRFGAALALSDDGATLLVGAPSEDGGIPGFGGDPDDNSVSGSGALYLF